MPSVSGQGGIHVHAGTRRCRGSDAYATAWQSPQSGAAATSGCGVGTRSMARALGKAARGIGTGNEWWLYGWFISLVSAAGQEDGEMQWFRLAHLRAEV